MVDAAVEVEVELLAPEPLHATPEALPLQVVFEDEDLLVIDKPAGMVVHAGPGHSHGTLVNAYHSRSPLSAGRIRRSQPGSTVETCALMR